MARQPLIASIALVLLGLGGSCTTLQAPPSAGRAASCVRATIDELGRNPGQYGGTRVCLSGFFGRMIPYGETSAELFATKEQAETIHADYYVELEVELDLRTQERLSHYSAQPVQVEGIFEFDAECWPQGENAEPDYTCFPPRPMRLSYPLLRFSDGARFR